MSAEIFNSRGSSRLEYRIGTFGSFLTEMKSRLASAAYPELAALTTRDRSDPSIALLDAWAIVADVLTFYQERIANEGFLRTASERRSIFELAHLVGFTPRPGVAARVFLAYGLEKDARLTIKKGSRSQSVPGPGELPQTYETSEDLVARAEWNSLAPRTVIPQTIGDRTRVLYFKGANLGLKANDPLLFVKKSADANGNVTTGSPTRFVRIYSVEESFEKGTTTVVLNPPPPELWAAPEEVTFSETAANMVLRLDESLEVSNTRAAPAVEATDLLNSSAFGDVLSELDPRVSPHELNAAARAQAPDVGDTDVYAFRVHSAPFGHNAPQRPVFGMPATTGTSDGAVVAGRTVVGYAEWELKVDTSTEPLPANSTAGERSDSITLASAHENILPGSWVAILRPSTDKGAKRASRILLAYPADAVEDISRADYGVTARATRIGLQNGSRFDLVLTASPPEAISHGWLERVDDDKKVRPDVGAGFRLIRDTVVYAQSERLELAEQPLFEPIAGSTIELDSVYDAIDEGRWLFVEGERADILRDPPAQMEVDDKKATGEALNISSSGIRSAEIVRVARVVHKPTHGPSDRLHSRVTLSSGLAHAYKRDTVTILGNVVSATHGETRSEVVGSGDATQPYQTFALRQGPVTFVPAATPSGAASTVELRVNDIAWHEVDSLIGAGADERAFVAEIDDKGAVRAIFGDGRRGARVPTGIENVRARYRVGIGAAGNVSAERVSQLMDRPLGAKDVRNPLPARGGGDPDTPDQARVIAPLSVKALDRLVSVSDYRDFAQLFAGIAKATATEEWAGDRPAIVVTVAAAGGLPMAGSALHQSLSTALRRLGDPSRRVEVVDFDRHLLVLEAGVRLLPDYLFESVRPKLLHAVLDAFSFERRRLGDDLPLAHVLAVLQSVEGVHSVDVDVFATISAVDVENEAALKATVEALTRGGLPPERLPIKAAPTRAGNHASPGWLVYASPRVPATLRLQEIP